MVATQEGERVKEVSDVSEERGRLSEGGEVLV